MYITFHSICRSACYSAKLNRVLKHECLIKIPPSDFGTFVHKYFTYRQFGFSKGRLTFSSIYIYLDNQCIPMSKLKNSSRQTKLSFCVRQQPGGEHTENIHKHIHQIEMTCSWGSSGTGNVGNNRRREVNIELSFV